MIDCASKAYLGGGGRARKKLHQQQRGNEASRGHARAGEHGGRLSGAVISTTEPAIAEVVAAGAPALIPDLTHVLPDGLGIAGDGAENAARHQRVRRKIFDQRPHADGPPKSECWLKSMAEHNRSSRGSQHE